MFSVAGLLPAQKDLRRFANRPAEHNKDHRLHRFIKENQGFVRTCVRKHFNAARVQRCSGRQLLERPAHEDFCNNLKTKKRKDIETEAFQGLKVSQRLSTCHS